MIKSMKRSFWFYLLILGGLFLAIIGYKIIKETAIEIRNKPFQKEYLNIYVLINSADKDVIQQEKDKAKAKYQEAYDRLTRLETEKPDWEPTIVKYRLEYLREKLGIIPNENPPSHGLITTVTYSDELMVKAESGDVKAQVDLAKCYRKGSGVAKNDNKAFTWAEKAAEQKNREAQFLTAVCYFQGEGVTRDEKMAVKIFSELAALDYTRAQLGLGICLLQGRGVEKNEKEAAHLFLKIAEKGDANGQFYLGKCLLEGIGIAKNKAEAIKWLEKSKTQGNSSARRLLVQIARE